ncbi:putative nucleoside hydrolase [Lunatimonas lonarensis]|uniref:Putative nucleoside hydrolase n=1 Tax=Lunatimonas lonarensis TaxID=1232681 RepID=R7ZYQ8_9BACT|nr:nucleoside hydrolase [Lunatimonas lonarensis]EON79236.1 putative nucleoside hydrolase [Lunatimonas lonarensis]
MQKIATSLILLLLLACAPPQAEQKEPFLNKPIKIILDTDMGSDCDDAGAFAVLHRYADLGRAEIIGCIYSSGKVPFGAGIVDAINRYYGRPDIPIGAYYGTDVGDPVDKMTAEKLARDTAAFNNRIIYNTDAEEQTRLNRRLLAGSEDHSITYVTIGHTKGLYDLMVSAPDEVSSLSGYELVSQKIDRWIAMGGVNVANPSQEFFQDWNLFRNGSAEYSAYLIANFPRPAYFSDGGSQVMTGKSLVQAPSGSIVRTVYRDWLWNMSKHTLADQRPSWDLIAVYFAVEGLGEFLKDSGNGQMEVDLERGVRWLADDQVKDRTLIQQREGTDELFADYLNGLLGADPSHHQE